MEGWTWPESEAWWQTEAAAADPPVAETDATIGTALSSAEKVKETCRLIRAARGHWDAHHNAATRMIRKKALALYRTLTPDEKAQIPQQLKVWLRYRSEKYFGPIRRKGRGQA